MQRTYRDFQTQNVLTDVCIGVHCVCADLEQMSADLAALGYDPPTGISATSGDGLADLYQLLQPLVDAAGQQLQQQWQQSGPQAQQQLLQRSRSAVLVQQPQQRQQQRQHGWDHSEGSSMVQTEQVLVSADHLDHQSDLDAAAAAAAEAEETAVDALVQQHMVSSTAAASSDSDFDDEAAGSYLNAAAAADDGDYDTEISTTVSPDQVGDEEAQLQQHIQGSEAAQGPVRLAILGLPNVGKSTLMNSLLGFERSLTGGLSGREGGREGGRLQPTVGGRAGGWVGGWVNGWVGRRVCRWACGTVS